MNTKLISVEEVEEGDVILVDGSAELVEDLYENGRMDGVWLRFASCLDRFYSYNDEVNLVTEGA